MKWKNYNMFTKITCNYNLQNGSLNYLKSSSLTARDTYYMHPSFSRDIFNRKYYYIYDGIMEIWLES